MSFVEPVDDMVTEATLQSDSGQFAVVVDKFTSIESLIRRRRCFPDVKDEIIAQINEVLKLIKCKEEVRLKSTLIVLRAWSTGLHSQPERYKQHDSRREKGFFQAYHKLEHEASGREQVLLHFGKTSCEREP
jgi:hypothetical protein